jgi:hypothetical protein
MSGHTHEDSDDAARNARRCAPNAGREFLVIVAKMDDDLREAVHDELAPCGEGEFLAVYNHLHRLRHGTSLTYVGRPRQGTAKGLWPPAT